MILRGKFYIANDMRRQASRPMTCFSSVPGQKKKCDSYAAYKAAIAFPVGVLDNHSLRLDSIHTGTV